MDMKAKSEKTVMVGMDIHGNNVVCGVVDTSGKRLKEKRLPCDLDEITKWLEPMRDRLGTIAIESTFNWYWLVDGLTERGFDVVLANPAKIVQFEGCKHTNDKTDAYFLAELLRLDILPTGHIYDRETRPLRDLLRRRSLLVRMSTIVKLSIKSLHARTLGQSLSLTRLNNLTPDEVKALFEAPAEQLIAGEQFRILTELQSSIAQIEKMALGTVKNWKSFQGLQSMPGVGKILGLTIALETGPIERFARAGNYASYCRCVKSQRISNGKAKGANNGRNGNKYLAWAWIEAAQFARRHYAPCREFFDRKARQVNTTLATKALACKLSKAAWYVMRDGVPFKFEKAFSGSANKTAKNKTNKKNKAVKKMSE